MDRIVIEVNEATAKKWRILSPKTRLEINRKIDQLLQVSLDKPDGQFWELVDSIREEAQQKGLTEDELQRILNE